MSVGNLKDKLELAKLDDFRQDIKAFNGWFTNKWTKIVKEVGTEVYTNYLGSLFKIYKTANNKEVMATIVEERCKWMIECLKSGYGYSDLMELSLEPYNKQKALEEWDAGKKLSKNTKRKNM
eukprot:2884648-Ditylum_brightwellii.AAC.1